MILPPPRRPPQRPPETPRPTLDRWDRLIHSIDMLRGEMRTSFAALERRIQGTAEGVARPSDPPRGYTLPMTPTGRVLLDEVQDELDKLRRERERAEHKAALEHEAANIAAAQLGAAQAEGDARVRRWTSIGSVLIALAGLLGGLIQHFLMR